MKKKCKAILSVFVALAIVSSLLAFSFNVFAKSHYGIQINTLYTDTIDGEGDKVWYYFTPTYSGTYSFLSFNTRRSEAYLFIREADALNAHKVMTQLAYSNNNPDYQSRGQRNKNQFCLTYHLEAGQQYIFIAGFWLDETESLPMNVKLVCDSYDNNIIDSIELTPNAFYEKNTYGEWKTDANANPYFHYNISRVIQNLTVKVNYKDGTSTTVSGVDEVDGIPITYIENQNAEHWYPQTDSNYTGNTFTVSILGVTASFPVEIIDNTYSTVNLKFVDYITGEPLAVATIKVNDVDAVTDSAGIATVSVAEGTTSLTVDAVDCAVPRTVSLPQIAASSAYDYSTIPIGLVTSDYVNDDIVNAKDFGYIIRTYSGSFFESEKTKFSQSINFRQSDYPQLTLQ